LADDKQDTKRQPEDDRVPMTTFGAGERFKESVYAVGDITLFRPMSFLELLVGIPLCALVCYTVIYPLTSGTLAFAIFAVMIYFAPKALVWLEARAGRPIAAEAAASVRFGWNTVTGQNLYQGVQRLSPREHGYQRKRLQAMLATEDEAHRELTEDRKRPGEE